MKTASIRVMTEPKLKKEVERIFKKSGLTTTDAINLFYKQVKQKKRIPFDIKSPNKVTKDTFEKTDKRKELVRFNSIDELLKELKT
ncbi:MAG: type II toxin-antitoxin system RelB/DinJ family antitoxin [Ignavibacteria bacterium]